MAATTLTVLMVGSGGVGSAAAKIAARRDFFARYVVTDYDLARAERVVDELGDARFIAARIDASSADDAPPWRESMVQLMSSTLSIRGSSCRSSRARLLPEPTTSTWRCRCRTSIQISRTS